MKNVPKLRFKGFSSEWKVTRLEEKFSFIRNGFVGIATPYYANSGIKYLQGKNIKNGSIDNTGLIYISDAFNSKYKKSQLKLNDIVMVQSGHVGECAVIDNEYVGSNCHALVILTPHSSNAVSSKFLVNYFYSSYGRKLIDKVKTGNTIEHILASEVKTLSPMLPDNVKEQTKIADFLTAIDDRISQLSQKCDGLAQYKKGVMQKIFSQELRFKDEKGRAFPAWEEKRLGDVFTEILDKIGDADIETYSISAGKGFVSQKEKFGRDISGMQNSKYIKLKPSEFAYNKGSSKAFVYGCVYPNTTGKEIGVPNVFICFRSMASVATGFYAKLFERNYLDKHLKNIISSSARLDGLLNVNKVDFFNILLPYPCFKEQEKIAGFLGALDEKISHAQSQLAALKQYKQGLLQQMFV